MSATNSLAPPPLRLALFWKLFCFAIVVLIGHFIAYLGAVLMRVATNVSATIWQPVLLTLVVLMISARFLRTFERQSLGAVGLGFDHAWMRQLSVGFLFGGVLVGLVWGALWSTGVATWSASERLAQQIPRLLVAAVISFAVALNEEVLYRGYAFQVLYRWNRAVAFLFTGVLFALIHVTLPGGTSVWVVLNMLLGHALFALCFLRTRSLWSAVGVHFAWNFVLAFVLGMPVSGRRTTTSWLRTEVTPSVLGGNEFGPEGGLAATVVLAAAAFLIWRLTPTRTAASRLVDESVAFPSTDARDAAPVTRTDRTIPALAPQLDRMAALDMLRALALFGIFAFNIQGFALHEAAAMNPYACPWTDSLNVGVWVVSTALFGRKDLMLFTMLFGAGVLMVADRCADAGRGAVQLQLQRMGALMVIGLLHAYLIWHGDILFSYAVCGLLVFPCRRWSAKWLISIGCLLYLVPMLLLVIAQIVVPHLREEWRTTIWAAFTPDPAAVAQYYDAYRGSWWSQMSQRVPAAIAQQTVLLGTAMGWVSAGMMLVGMGLYRLGYMTAAHSRRTYWRMIAWTLPIGATLTAGGYWLNFREGWRAEFSFLIGRLPGELGAPFLGLTCLAVVILASRWLENVWLGKALACVGRMSLTNYLMQSVICTFLFYGFGLGWIGYVDRVQQAGLVLGIFSLELAFSRLWLARFQFGPVEWLWRSMAYVSRQPMIARPTVNA